MKQIITVVGARPQFIKVGPVSSAITKSGQANEIIVHTGQHFDDNMSDIFFRQLRLPQPEINLAIGSGSHAEQTAKMLVGLESVFLARSPDIILVYGDTNSTLAGALAAAKLHIPIAHVEAGLRSFNRQMPEEINRIIVDKLSSLLFTPSDVATQNLALEGIDDPRSVFQVGDVMYDAILENIKEARIESRALQQFQLKSRNYILLTMHRAENTDSDARLGLLLDEIINLASMNKILFPIHPRTRQAAARIGRLDELSRSLQLVEPVGYTDTIILIENAKMVLTDSGGMQKEAMFLQTPCVTLRNETEWVETISTHANCLYQPGSESLSELVMRQMGRAHYFKAQPYGAGDAGIKISELLMQFL